MAGPRRWCFLGRSTQLDWDIRPVGLVRRCGLTLRKRVSGWTRCPLSQDPDGSWKLEDLKLEGDIVQGDETRNN
ncbi:hypothetical protein NDU88_004256 [Pleurodeles waltl]|uniref:Uncharacterized protein n=1 Tax=Pleurodeles waltl TaxID=8319 RepID=A0AAV7RF81_PLEWA|nr:hypothetical protein NDU88_004256 [Pleurodeles waltl]